MLLPSFFVVGLGDYDDLPDIQLPENAVICFKANSDSLHQIDSFYSKLFLQPKNYPFCMLIDVENELVESKTTADNTIDFIVSLSFHSKYVKTSHDLPLLLFENTPGSTDNMVIIREAFKSQGYSDIDGRVICASDTSFAKNGSKSILFGSPKDIEELLSEYIGTVKGLNSSDAFCLFLLNDPREFGKILDAIQRAEIIIREEMPQTYSLLEENTALANEKRDLLFKIDLLQEQLDSIGNYRLAYDASDTRYRRQITELLRFYKNEYEILPMWYKRFGHVIKVLTGKRTFRSLFNDNVKKYKD